MFRYLFLAAILAAMIIAPRNTVAQATTATPVGEWLVADGSARIRIQPCDEALWGVIVWATDPGKDENNPDPALRERSVIGMPILLGMEQTRQNRWDGQIYNAENGKTYTANISLIRDDVLRVEGCVFGGLFCGGENWTRETAQSDPARATPPRLVNFCP